MVLLEASVKDLHVITVCLFIHFLCRGNQFSHIFYDSEASSWILESLIRPGTRRFLAGGRKAHPFGERKWMGTNHCGTGNLTLSRCALDEFTCQGGHCIPIG